VAPILAIFVGLAHFVDDHRQRAADLRLSLAALIARGLDHDPGVAFFLDLLGHRIGQGVGRGAFDRLKPECADPVELGFVQPVEQILEIGLGLAGKADDEARADRDVGADRAPAADALRAPWPRWPGASSPSGRWARRAGTECRDRA
jgi:hypothetical protein